MHFTQDQISSLKEKLLSEEKELQEQIKQLSSSLDFGDDTDHLEEEEDETEEIGNVIGVTSVLKNRLEAIRHAIEKMEGGSGFGLCESCGKQISFELLEVQPESKLCKGCKKEGK